MALRLLQITLLLTLLALEQHADTAAVELATGIVLVPIRQGVALAAGPEVLDVTLLVDALGAGFIGSIGGRKVLARGYVGGGGDGGPNEGERHQGEDVEDHGGDCGCLDSFGGADCLSVEVREERYCGVATREGRARKKVRQRV
jgi:hypothetical protein